MAKDMCRITLSKDTKEGIKYAKEFSENTLTLRTKDGWIAYCYGKLPNDQKLVECEELGVKMEMLPKEEAAYIERYFERRKAERAMNQTDR